MSLQTPQNRYGRAHKALRKRLRPVVESGAAICWRCGDPIAAGAEWDLGHDDEDPTKYAGPEHVVCNRGTTPRRPVVRRSSREW